MSTPNREAYQLPTTATTTATTTAATTTTATPNNATTSYTPTYGISSGGGSGSAFLDPPRASVTYTCGECASKVALNLGDAIRCKECGHRVLYKERTKRMVQFDAR